MKVCKVRCSTCPFRDESPYAYLRDTLTESALNSRSRICHSTGSNNAINKYTGKPPEICRGARDAQLKALFSVGFLREATDAAWEEKCRELGIEPNSD